jgi:hypothetical protein
MRQVSTGADFRSVRLGDAKSRRNGGNRDAREARLNLLAIDLFCQPVWQVRRIPPLNGCGMLPLLPGLFGPGLGTVPDHPPKLCRSDEPFPGNSHGAWRAITLAELDVRAPDPTDSRRPGRGRSWQTRRLNAGRGRGFPAGRKSARRRAPFISSQLKPAAIRKASPAPRPGPCLDRSPASAPTHRSSQRDSLPTRSWNPMD